MQPEQYYRKITCELINNSGSEIEALQKINMIKGALKFESEIFNQLSQLQPRLKRMLKKSQLGTIDYDSYEINFNKILDSANQILRTIELKDIAIEFEYDQKEELIYHIKNSQDELIYKYVGSFRDYMPYGKGRAQYPNGEVYKGDFIKGNRDGKGTLYGEDNRIIFDGKWLKDKFIDKNIIKFYSNLTAAANSINASEVIKKENFEIIKIPQLVGENMIAFPIEGNSMEPNFFEDEIIICKELNSHRDITDGQVYVIFHDDTLVLKRVKKVTTRPNEVQRYSLISDNYTNHFPYQIVPNEKTKFFGLLMQLKTP